VAPHATLNGAIKGAFLLAAGPEKSRAHGNDTIYAHPDYAG